MSLVGPRPLRMRYLPRYTAEQARRHEVRPGITGWAQVHGRNAIPWDRKFELDVWYVRHVSLALDLEILGRTLRAIVRREGIAAEGHATTPEFTGRPGLANGRAVKAPSGRRERQAPGAGSGRAAATASPAAPRFAPYSFSRL